MSENREFDQAAGKRQPDVTPEPKAPGTEAVEGELAEGQYVEGDYGAAGVTGENPPTAPEKGYAAGDYGEAGMTEAAIVADQEGDYAEGDYGVAGEAGEAARRPRSSARMATAGPCGGRGAARRGRL